MNSPPDLALFFGRLHPLLVHLPIALLLLVALLELLSRSTRLRHANASAGMILAVAVPAALVTALCGWLLSLGGGYENRLLQWHKWMGISTAAIVVLAGLLYRLELKKPYRWCLAGGVVVLSAASHFGGSLTHGSDYLVHYAPRSLRAFLTPIVTFPAGGKAAVRQPELTAIDAENQPVFAGLIQPMFNHDCVSCHGPEKSKAGLRLDSLAAALEGSESGPVIIPGHAADSILVKRLHLPLDDEDHMPPSGKTQPAADDLELLAWWIDSGAPADKKIVELKPTPGISRILAQRHLGPAGPAEAGAGPAEASSHPTPRPLAEVGPLVSKLTAELNIPISPLSQTEAWLQANASVAGSNFDDASFARLAPIAANLRWLDLAGTAVSDAGLAPLEAMPGLTRLHLERTTITDAGLAHLARLAELEYLNLYGTQVTDAALSHLQPLPRLKQLYLWQTKVTPAAVAAFTAARTDKEQLQRWQDEIEQLQAKIKEAQVVVNLGLTTASNSAANATPVNSQCPVSGKPVDASKTVLHDGALVAFCCDDCKAKFQRDPKPFLAKLASRSLSTETNRTRER